MSCNLLNILLVSYLDLTLNDLARLQLERSSFTLFLVVYSVHFLADRTIGRAFGTVCRLSVVCDVLYSGEAAEPICVKFSGKVWSDHERT